MIRWLFILMFVPILLLTACSTGGDGGGREYKTPSMSGDASRMSSDTLCYRAATGTKNQSITDEIKARNLDCESILATDPLYQGQ